jgi:hypothetical protein
MVDIAGLLSAVALLLGSLLGGALPPLPPLPPLPSSPPLSPLTPPAAGGTDPAASAVDAAVRAAAAAGASAADTAIAQAGALGATQASAQAAVEAALQAVDLGPLAILGTTMTGAQEVPGPGDPDGRGTATIALLPDGRTLCYLLTATGIEPATAAHIHRGSPTEAGPVVVPLSPPTAGISGGCTVIDPALHQAIRTMPSAYYVNVHNRPFPDGAIRGQL